MLSVCRFEADYVLTSPHLKDVFIPIWSGPFLEAIGEGTTETNFEDPRQLKKGELVTAAERRLMGSLWLPEILKR